MALLTLTDIRKTYDSARPLITGVSLVVRDGDRIGLIGPNGSGKSTLLRIMAGVEEPDDGERVVKRGLRIGYLEQEPRFDPEQTVREVVHAGLEGRAEVVAAFEQVCAELAGPGLQPAQMDRLVKRQESLQHQLDLLGGHDVEHLVEGTIAGVGLPDPDVTCAHLSGGEARRAALAQLLVSAPDLLLLDEPTNHLDAFVVAWLEERLVELRVPLVLVTHDRYLLERAVSRIVEIDRGSAYDYEGSYGRYLQLRAERLGAEQRVEHARASMLRRETEWMRRGPPARTTKAKARIQRYDALVDGTPDTAPQDLELEIPKGPRLGSKVVELHGVSHRFGDLSVVPNLDFTLENGMRLGLVGPNGAGKTTLLRILLGQLQPTTGRVVVGETVRFGTVDQRRSDLDPDATVVQEVAGHNDYVRIGDRSVHVASFLDGFLFPGSRKDTPVGQLSGGERGRVLLAKLLLTGANVLVLDEPTNDLDLMTLRALEEALCAFDGSVIVVSHDRWFLDRVATHVLHLDGHGGVRLHTGDVSSLVDRLARESAGTQAQSGERDVAEGRSRSEPTGTPPKAGGDAATSAATDAAPTPTASKRKRLSSWEERELEQLTARIEQLESSIAEIDTRLANPSVYAGDGAEARKLQTRRATADTELRTSLTRWEELAERA